MGRSDNSDRFAPVDLCHPRDLTETGQIGKINQLRL